MHALRQLPRLLAKRGAVHFQHAHVRRDSSVAAVPVQKYWAGGKYLLGLGAFGFAAQSEEIRDHAHLAWLIPTRLARDIVSAVSIVTGTFGFAAGCQT